MGTVDRELRSLYRAVDEQARCCPDEVREALEAIVEREPESDRARGLLDRLDGDPLVEDPIVLVIEAAEGLADKGMSVQAREVADYVARRFGESAYAKRWLEGVELLLED